MYMSICVNAYVVSLMYFLESRDYVCTLPAFLFFQGNCGLQMLLIDIWICMPITATSVFSWENDFTMSGFLLWIYDQLCQCFTRRVARQNQVQCFKNWGRWSWNLYFKARWVTEDKKSFFFMHLDKTRTIFHT